jgi:formylmethanofuran dehydrogenase subunit B
MDATVAGTPASLDEAVEAAAELLRASRAPLIAGMHVDHEGAMAALTLAERIGAVVDHAQADALLADLDAMRGGGWIAVTPPAARAVADIVLLVGERAQGPEGSKRTIRLQHGEGREQACVLLGALRALVAGRPANLSTGQQTALGQIAQMLRAARYAVIAWAADEIGPLGVEMAAGLVADLNATTRAAALPMPAEGNAPGVAFALSPACGYPVRVRLDDGKVQHDPWRFDARRMLEEREADALVWIDPLGTAGPPPKTDVPTVVLGNAEAARVAIPIGCPGQDHDAVLYDAALGGLRAVAAQRASNAPRAADILRRIAGAC